VIHILISSVRILSLGSPASYPQPRILSLGSSASYPQPQILSLGSSASDPHPHILSLGSSASDGRPHILSLGSSPSYPQPRIHSPGFLSLRSPRLILLSPISLNFTPLSPRSSSPDPRREGMARTLVCTSRGRPVRRPALAAPHARPQASQQAGRHLVSTSHGKQAYQPKLF